MRLGGKVALVIGAGQSPGEGIGNGRATVLRFVQEGARVLAADRDPASAAETADLAAAAGGECVPFAADVVREAGASAPVMMQVEALYRAAAHTIGAGEDHTAALRMIEHFNDKEIK